MLNHVQAYYKFTEHVELEYIYFTIAIQSILLVFFV